MSTTDGHICGLCKYSNILYNGDVLCLIDDNEIEVGYDDCCEYFDYTDDYSGSFITFIC